MACSCAESSATMPAVPSAPSGEVTAEVLNPYVTLAPDADFS